MSSIRILIIDDNPALCEAVEHWLSRQPGIASVSSETDWRRAEQDARDRAPDVILLDIDMPGASGLDLIAPLMAARPAAKVVIFSGQAPRASVEQALDSGAAGYIIKDQETTVIADLVRRAAKGELVLCPTAAEALMGPPDSA